MNRKELIERIKNLPFSYIHNEPYLNKEAVLEFVKHLDEPQKVTIPQYIADKIEYFKESGDWDLFQAMDYCFNFRECSSWLENKNNQEIFAQAWIFGYEVEKEERYLVKMKNILDRESFLNLSNTTKIWFFGDKKDTEYVYVHHTRTELEEAGFGWVFDCPGIEIEEVE